MRAKTQKPLRSDAERSLTLLHVFLVASAAILLAGGAILGAVLTRSLRAQALADRQAGLAQYVDGVLRPTLVRGDRVVVTPHLSRALEEGLRHAPDLVTVKVWRPDGVLAWTNRGRDRIGRRFALDGDLAETVRENRAVGELGELEGAESRVERDLGLDEALEVYAPIADSTGRRAIGAYEIYADPRELEQFIASRKRLVWLAVLGVFASLYAALALLVRGASRTLRRQTASLRESYRLLEASSLEAIETLNATVDAKDPYTAGHSARVQRICLAIGEQLGLPPERMDALRYGGLLHDIGKLRVPDAVLTKPSRLSDDEFELIKRHPTDGAAIVSKLARLHDAVPIVRHHHERWDGRGYPDGLAGDAIPVEAAIAGLADAWDAMTSDRPYRPGLDVREAFDEIRRCRGTQFAPAVVDAFFAAARVRPAAFRPPAPAPLQVVG